MGIEAWELKCMQVLYKLGIFIFKKRKNEQENSLNQMFISDFFFLSKILLKQRELRAILSPRIEKS